ncbi:hypothetical protein D3C87_1393570 [compost metagenome]
MAAPPSRCRRRFHLAAEGSQTSMPMPRVVEGASAGPAWPGPTSSFTRHRSDAATGVLPVAVPDSSSASPALKALTSSTCVSASRWNAVFNDSSQVSGAGDAAGGGAGEGAGGGTKPKRPPPPPLLPPPQATSAAHSPPAAMRALARSRAWMSIVLSMRPPGSNGEKAIRSCARCRTAARAPDAPACWPATSRPPRRPRCLGCARASRCRTARCAC